MHRALTVSTEPDRHAVERHALALELDPEAALEELATWRAPYLVGVRHHSPVLARALPPLLDALLPDLLLVELPEEVQPWLVWLGADGLEAPVALAAARADGRGLLFYPFADFSPELAAIRWAVRNGVAVEAFDLPVGLSPDDSTELRTRLAPNEDSPLSAALRAQLGAPNAVELWDRLVEARATGAEPDQVRRAALAVGWALRLEQATWGEVPAHDLHREAFMRQCVAAARERGVQRPAAVVGAFHAPALVDTADDSHIPPAVRKSRVVTSLVPYGFELLDSRTGYGAGIRDPEWQQAFWSGGCTPEAAAQAANSAIVRICRELRERGHAAGVPDAREASRLAADLARLRGLAGPGRRELVEAVQSGLAQGEPLGRGRVVAAAMQRVLVGRRRGRLGAGTPRSGLLPHVEALATELRFPGPNDTEASELRLDPLRSDLDRRRHVAIQRLLACGIPYAEPLTVDPDHLTGRWRLRWEPATSAMLELAGHRGVTLAQAAEGALRSRLADAEREDRLTAPLRLLVLLAAAECGLPALTRHELDGLTEDFTEQASLSDLIEAVELVDRIARSHVPGFEPDPALRARLARGVLPTLIGAALHQVEGLVGSERAEDARALLALVQRLQRGDAGALVLGDSRLRWALERLERDGSPLMQGAGGAIRVLLGLADANDFGERMGSWVDAATDRSGQTLLAGRLVGALLIAAPLLEAAPAITERLIARVTALDDAGFLGRLPSLRDAFDVLSPAARHRFLAALGPTLSGSVDLRLDYPAALLGRWADADHAARQAIVALDPGVLTWGDLP